MYANPKVWKEQRDKKMQLANHICEDCGKSAKHVHHIDGTSYNHFMENLKALCVKCHKAYHPSKMVDFDMLTHGGRLKLLRLEAGYEKKDVIGETGLLLRDLERIERSSDIDWKDVVLNLLRNVYATNNKSILEWNKNQVG